MDCRASEASETLRGWAWGRTGLNAILVAASASLGACVGVDDPEPGVVESPVEQLELARVAPQEISGWDSFTPAYTPLAIQRERVKVIVKMRDDPVARVKARDRALGKAEQRRIAATLKASQAGIARSVAQRGGKVLAQYQWAYNGLKIEIGRDQLASLRQLPGVEDVNPVEVFERTHQNSVPLIGAPSVWGGTPAFKGEGIKIAIIDTGIDYTHADFGGPGTAAAYKAADAADTVPAAPGLFGPAAPKVKGGIDLAGDSYNASDPDHDVPMPDPNPLDCNGHGTHVAGSSAGFGVQPDGSTYTGPYDAATFSAAFKVGPGVAPLADLYAVRVFGCEGSTDLTVEAIDWAVENDMDVVNMSLGSEFGRRDAPSAEAASNAALAGVVMVASAGNAGPNPYITGSPATGDRVISVAANDAVASLPGAKLSLATGKSLIALNANASVLTDGMSVPVAVLRSSDGSVSLGCDPAEYVGVATGNLVVTVRGTCARVARAIFGQKAGAAAVAMVNTSAVYPPFEGEITSNPDTGEELTVTIPFFGVRGVLGPNPEADGDDLVAADGKLATVTSAVILNPNYTGFAGFTSSGPRTGDGALKPDVTAPGVSVLSAGVGTGSGGARLSGTSMAAPHVSGVAALTRQAHPGWSVEDLKAAIVNTADPSQIGGATPYRTRRGGSGLVSAGGSTATQVVAVGDPGTAALSFGVVETRTNFSATKSIKVRNHGSSAATFAIAAVATPNSRAHSVTPAASSITVPAGGEVTLAITLSVPVATAGSSAAFREVAGLVTLTPAAGNNGGIALRVPYYLVPRALSNVEAGLANKGAFSTSSTTANVTNEGGGIAGTADFYAWGLADDKERLKGNDLRAVGVQAFDAPTTTPPDPTRRLAVFAVNNWGRWSNAAVSEYDIWIDVNGDGRDDYLVVGVDLGLLTAGDFDGTMATAVFPVTHKQRRPVLGDPSVAFLATAPTDSGTLLLPVRIQSSGTSATANQLCMKYPAAPRNHPCLSAANPRFTYRVEAFSFVGTGDDAIAGTAKFNAWSSSISTGQAVAVNPNQSGTAEVRVDATEWRNTPARGLMIVTLDNKSGGDEAKLLPVTVAQPSLAQAP